jgi:hypothetical protein
MTALGTRGRVGFPDTLRWPCNWSEECGCHFLSSICWEPKGLDNNNNNNIIITSAHGRMLCMTSGLLKTCLRQEAHSYQTVTSFDAAVEEERKGEEGLHDPRARERRLPATSSTSPTITRSCRRLS